MRHHLESRPSHQCIGGHHRVTSILVLIIASLVPLMSQAVTPELLVLQQQYEKLLNERVTTVHEGNLGQLNARYLQAVERSIATVKAAGDLTEVLALENEKNLITDKKSVPDDDENTKPTLKKLRAVYREQLEKLEAQRTADHAVILGPYLTRLKQIEVTLTKTNRVSDAKEILDYRSSLEENAGSASVSTSTKDIITNSLGMKFVPIKGTTVHFCIHETRRQDYMAFANEVKDADPGWKNFVKEGVAIGHEDNHPVVNVPWEWAKNFCEWLSKKEGKVYRLPTDKEWSYAAGNGNSEKWTKNATPESLDGKAEGYPWGRKYPPKVGELVGNYADRTFITRFPNSPLIPGYTDGFVSTAPVMSFKPNQNGLYDMGGNVWEWIEDWWNGEKVQHVLRGGGWLNFGESLRSSHRSLFDGGIEYWGMNGFRVVLERP